MELASTPFGTTPGPAPAGSSGRAAPTALLVMLVIIVIMVATNAGAQTPAEPKTYQTSFEVAEALAAIDELWEEGNDMLELDRAQSAILDGACSNPWRDLAESDREVGMLAERKRAGETLTRDEEAWDREQQARRAVADRDFDACFAREASRYEVLRRLRVGSNDGIVEAYRQASADYARRLGAFADAENPTLTRLRSAYPRVPDGSTETAEVQRTLDTWREEQAKLETQHDKIIARFESVWDLVEVGRDGRWSRAAVDQKIRMGDSIRTGPKGIARIDFLDKDARNFAGPTIVHLANSSHIKMSEWGISLSKARNERTGLVAIIKGIIRAATVNWSSGSSFAVRTGTSLCGIRGTEIEIVYDPERQQVDYKLYEGEVQIEPGLGPAFSLRAGSGVTVTEGVAGPIRPIRPLERPPA